MGQSGVGGSGSILGSLVAKRTQINAIRQKLGLTPGTERGVPQGGLKRAAPTSPAGPAAPPAPRQQRAATAAPGPVQPVGMAADKRKAMLEQASSFLAGLRQMTPAQPAAPPQPRGSTVLGRARQMLSGGV
jgi:hypothetical protein